jgi:predicted metal-dependent HD superfamily phosphohydrolase
LASGDKLVAVRDFAYRYMPNHLYHNFNHAVDVYNIVTELAEAEGVRPWETELLQTAAWFHDMVFLPGSPENEEHSAGLAKHYMISNKGFTMYHADVVADLIMATKYPTNPKGRLQEILCDADTVNVGREDFFEKSYAVFMEMRLPHEKWTGAQIEFLKDHQFYTESAKKIYGPGKDRNIRILGDRN